MKEILNDFKCPNCGGRLIFDTRSQMLKCPYCDSEFSPDSFDNGPGWSSENFKDESEELNLYTCRSCGGSIFTNANTAATKCPYCDNPIVLEGNLSGKFKPEKIIPFKKDKKYAMEKFSKHLSHKLFLPKEFVESAIVDEIQGVYVPYWFFSGNVHGEMFFRGTKILRDYRLGNFHYTKFGSFEIRRIGNSLFENIPADALNRVENELTESLEPFDLSESKEFSANYLSGFIAEKYDIDQEEARETVKNRIIQSMRENINQTVIGFENLSNLKDDVYINNVKVDYGLLPIWLLNIKYNDEIWRFAMNGQTGKFVGNLPRDLRKSILYGIGVFALVFLISILVFFVVGYWR